MPQKPKKAPRISQKSSAGSLALLVIDNEPIRREAFGDYLALERAAAQIRRQIEHFEKVERPAYDRWENALFGPLLTELEALNEAWQEKNDLLDEIEDEMEWSGCSRVVAYRRVMKMRSEPPTGEEEARHSSPPPDDEERDGGPRLFGKSDLPPGFKVEGFDQASKTEQKKFRRFFEEMAALFETMTGQPAPDLDEVLARERGDCDPAPADSRSGLGSSRPPAPDPDLRIKSLYRKIVRHLHPDANGAFTPHERELWDEAQSAYTALDLDRLEAVATRIELGTGADAASNASVGVLRRIIRDLQRTLDHIQQQLRIAKKQPSWRFQARAKDRPKMEEKRRRQIEGEITHRRRDLAELVRFLDDLARRAAPAASRKSKKSLPEDPQPALF